MNELSNTKSDIRLIASDKNWIEGDAVRQLHQAGELAGMRKVVGMPDIHPGKGGPVGAAFVTEGIFYPYLVGNDVGCGMGLWKTELRRKKIKRDKWTNKLAGFEKPWDGDGEGWIEEQEEISTESVSIEFDPALGTIGGGNHFAELQIIETVEDQDSFEMIGLDKKYLMLLVHSGSRGHGETLLRSHVSKYRDQGLADDTQDAAKYLSSYHYAVKWAEYNRSLIAHRFLSTLGADRKRIIDVCHNTITQKIVEKRSFWVHRKGAVPSDNGPVIISGSRDSFSYIVKPVGDQKLNAWSLAHGAGRKWKRSDCKKRLSSRYNAEALTHTELGGRVICEDKNLLYEEATQAYKKIAIVVQDLLDAGLIRVIATLRPLITYKMRKNDDFLAADKLRTRTRRVLHGRR